MIVLGIETSCDETSIAVIEGDSVLSNIISSQWVHQKFGGVVPELASREHVKLIIPVLKDALLKSGLTLTDVDAIAVTTGPGLIGAVMVGLNFAKGLAMALQIPFIGVNHMEGHIYSNFLSNPGLEPPMLAVVVSGGHTQLVLMREHLQYEIIGTTRDDAVGEAFDKVAKLLGLGYPGGPIIDELARQGNENAIPFPGGNIKGYPLDFSYSGLKTAVLYHVQKLSREEVEKNLADICASFQKAATNSILKRTEKAMKMNDISTVVLAGGVAANSRLRHQLLQMGEKMGWVVSIPDMEYCMDNAAMIARAGLQRLQNGEHSSLTQKPFATLPLTSKVF